MIMNELYQHDITMSQNGALRIAGIDEAGRGPLAGPVIAAAVILDLSAPIDGVNDSKKISEKKRDAIYEKIISSAKHYGIGIATPQEIDEINILQATFLAMRRALAALNADYDLLLVDGDKRIPDLSNINQQTIIGGDALSASIAAASIIAKVTRDRMMIDYHAKYPQYDFAKHKGYGTKLHTEKIMQHGLCDIHRRSFCGKFL